MCDLDMDSDIELTFMVYCLYEDIHELHELHELIKDTWRQHHDGVVKLCTASLVTNLALDLVQKYEAGLVTTSPKFHILDSYHTITSRVCPVDLLGLDTNTTSLSNEEEELLIPHCLLCFQGYCRN